MMVGNAFSSSKYGNLSKKSQIITYLRKIWMAYGMSGSTSRSIQKRKYHLVWPKSEEKQDNDDSTYQRPCNCWSGGHMTNCQKWSKMKVVALYCSFLNLVELYSEVLLMLIYHVKDFEKHHVFFFCIFLHETQNKQHDFTFRKLKERATILTLWGKWPKKGRCIL